MHKTHVVSSEESKPEQPESDVNSVAKSADQPSSVGENDIAWPVPVVAMYPLATALSGLMVWAFGLDWVLVSLIPFVIFLSAMTVIDLRELRIPDRLTKPAAMAMGAIYFILLFIYPAGMGFGDVKLAPIIGAQLGFFGWIPEVRGLIAAYLIVGPVAILLLIFGRAHAKTGFPFGPFMATGAVVALVLHARGY